MASREILLDLHPDDILSEESLRQALHSAGYRHFERCVVSKRAIDARHGKVRIHATILLDPGPAAPIEPPSLHCDGGEPRVVVIGAGPCGLFACFELARRGIRSVLLDRGQSLSPRRRDIAALTKRGELNPESNYCFGEGGAGTFSDGKLYTRSKKRGDIDTILRAFVSYGADPDILVDARPHIGTNRLPKLIQTMREHLESAGVQVRFGARVAGLLTKGGSCVGVKLADGTSIEARYVIVAPGHSARDVGPWLAEAGASVTSKPFAIGVRVEHSQKLIDRTQYGALAGHPILGAASYRLVEKTQSGTSFSFCMCPGGFIAPAATEIGGQVVNGWSPSSRNGRFANSGFVTEVGPREIERFGLDPSDRFAGVALQRIIEGRAYDAGGGDYVAPAQRIEDFVRDRVSRDLPESSYPRPMKAASLGDVLGALTPALKEALVRIDKKMPGYARGDAVALGVESRTSSPVRFDRDPATCQSIGLGNVYPAGEGAGFAGGIMSAALDGLKVADAIEKREGR